MKGMNCRGWILFSCVFIGLVLNACSYFGDQEPKNYTYFVSNESKTIVTAQEIKLKIQLAQKLIPEVAPIAGLVKNDVEVQKIVYKTPFLEQDIKASGLVYLPKQAGNYPVLCFQNGTNTEHSKAPSVNTESEMLFMLQCVASMGYIVVIPDYIGFGESSRFPHPYLHASSTTQSILNMLMAMNEYTTENDLWVQPTQDLFLFGYSQGGWANMLLQKEIETRHASEFNLIASACAAGPYSLEYMSEYITSQTDYSSPYFLASLFNSYTYIGLISNPLTDFIQEPYASVIPGLFDGTHSGSGINAQLTTHLGDLLTPEFRNDYSSNPKFAAFKSALKTNSAKVDDWQVSTPTRLFHGAEDQVIPVALSEQTLQDFRDAGNDESKIQLVILPKVGHADGVLPVGISTILWFTEISKQ